MISILIPNATEDRIQEVISEVEEEFPGSQIIICHDRYRQGKGWAVREAFTQAKYERVAFLDGDMDIHPRMIRRLLPHLKEFDIVVGKKDTRASFGRWLLTILSRMYIWLMFRIPVDTQTGVKVFWKYAIPDWHNDSYAFDIEILAKANKMGFTMFEVTVEAKRSKPMKMKSIIHTLIESLKIRGRL